MKHSQYRKWYFRSRTKLSKFANDALMTWLSQFTSVYRTVQSSGRGGIPQTISKLPLSVRFFTHMHAIHAAWENQMKMGT